MHDEALIALFFARDERAIAEVKTQYGAECERAAMNLLGDRHAAEEVLSDTLLALWNSIPPERPRSLKAFALTIAKRGALKAYREKTALKRGGNIRHESLDELAEALPHHGSVEGEVEARALSALLNRWLGELTGEERALFLRRYWFEYPVSEIAKRMGASASSVSGKLLNLRKGLKKYLEKEGFFV